MSLQISRETQTLLNIGRIIVSKQTANNHCACLGATTFEQLQIMKFAWRSKTMDITAINSQHVEEINVEPFQELLGEDRDFKGWDKDGLFVDDLDVDL
ncbi:hypothetical protein H0H87_005128 [Tephrocybe sp. NHM501043]|nr:hypothetical protein H0H87_005128 [Tephrocybe sp. NHM501043]